MSNTLSQTRREAGLTQSQLAEMVGIGRISIARYEAGTRTPPPKVAERIAEALGMDVETMWRVLYRPGGGLSMETTIAGAAGKEQGGRVHE